MKVKSEISGLLFLAVLFFLSGIPARGADVRNWLLSEQGVQPAGLTFSWFNQVPMDTAVDRITHVVLKDKVLFITTDSSILHVIDAETGSTLWWRRVGDKKYNTYQPTVNSKIVGVVNGTVLHIFDRFNGKYLLEIPLYGEPSAGPTASEKHIFVPLLSKKLFAFPLNPDTISRTNLEASLKEMDEVRKTVKFDEKVEKQIADLAKEGEHTQFLLKKIEDDQIVFCPMFGNTLVQPTLATQELRDEYISWTTDDGWLVIGILHSSKEATNLKIFYKISVIPQTVYVDHKRIGTRKIFEKNDVQSQPLFVETDLTRENLKVPEEERKGGLIIIGSDLGEVFAVNDHSGNVQWRFTTGSAISEKISCIEKTCFIPTESNILFCVDMETGGKIWDTPNITKVLSLSAQFVSALDLQGSLVILERASGKLLKRLSIPRFKFNLQNDESDRLYFITEDGLVQCLKDIRLTKPVLRETPSFAIAQRLAKEEAALHGIELAEKAAADPKAKKPDPNAKPEDAPGAEPPKDGKVPAPAGGGGMSSDDIFGESTGEKPKAPEKKEEKPKAKDPFGDNIFDNL
ncbi:MAG: PQQ-binding-like beta-propeller repeat protein [Planctomycetia bacterium]|nr:PQQ-binding-like beta-propeller repeat protein [Planctomycetia bacterium]